MTKLIEITLNNQNSISIKKNTCSNEALKYIKEYVNHKEDTNYIHITSNNIISILYQLSLINEIHLI
jgi:hypothetical protein